MTDTPADQLAEIIRDAVGVSAAISQRWYDRAKGKSHWAPEDVVGDSTDLFEHLTPVAEKSIDLMIEWMRPWARAFTEREEQ